MPAPRRFPTFEVREVRLGAGLELGCFAMVDIPAGAHIWRFTGPIFSYDEMAERVRALAAYIMLLAMRIPHGRQQSQFRRAAIDITRVRTGRPAAKMWSHLLKCSCTFITLYHFIHFHITNP